MKFLIFETLLAGHRLEYIHHIYQGAANRTEDDFVFVLPSSFDEARSNLDWPLLQNTRIELIPEEELGFLQMENGVTKKWKQYTLLKKYVKREKIDVLILIMLMNYLPFLFLPGMQNIKICGIIYKIYLYEQEKMSRVKLLANRFMFSMLAFQGRFEKLFVLNDKNSCISFNKSFHTGKFKYLPDPVPDIDDKALRNLRENMGAQDCDKVYLHFGGLAERKGTLNILKALELSNKEELEHKIFVFAGRIEPKIKNDFAKYLEVLSEKVRIKEYEGFCSYGMINNLCYSCDVILIPYSNTSQSSGVIGYAAHFRKPVIGPGKGLLGNLILDYNLGMVIDDVSPTGIKCALEKEICLSSNEYEKTHTVNDFVEILIS